MTFSTLSIIIPAFNEGPTIHLILDKVKAVQLVNDIKKEIIIVNDFSTDNTKDQIQKYQKANPELNIQYYEHEKNKGKGAALHTGISKAKGEYLIIQDADLEYDPEDYLPMLKPLLEGQADVVYGSRYMKYPESGLLKNLLTGKHAEQSWVAYLGGQSLSFVARLFVRGGSCQLWSWCCVRSVR